MAAIKVGVAVVVPMLNEAASIQKLLAGLAAQTRRPEEIILCDAGSTDGSRELAETWWAKNAWHGANMRILSKPGALPGAARNTGVSAAHSPWIAFIDGGIVPETNWIENLLGCAEALGARAVFGICDFSASDSQRAICALTYGYEATHPVLPASLFHRELFQAIGPFREDLRSAEDILWIRSFTRLFGAMPVCREARVHYSIHFPRTLTAIFKKWRMNTRSTVKAGVRKGQHVVYLLGLPVLWLTPLFNLPLGLTLIFAYVLARGIIDPARRSADAIWWRGLPGAFFKAIITAAVLDLAKWVGIVEGLVNIARENGSPKPASHADPDALPGLPADWTRLPNALPAAESRSIFDDYFAIFPWEVLPPQAVGADIGCGTGRWAKFASGKCHTLHVIDPSAQVIEAARQNLSEQKNVVFHLAGAFRLPFPDSALDFAYSLGILQHSARPQSALREIARILKPAAPLLVYLCYSFENRPAWFRLIWKFSDLVRAVVSKLPQSLRYGVCQALAATVYWPMARAGAVLEKLNRLPVGWPLAYYRDKSFYTMRTDAMARFGTQIENRMTREQIIELMESAGFNEVRFSKEQPFWCVVAKRMEVDRAFKR